MKQILVVCALLWGVFSGAAQAVQLIVVDGKLVGAKDVNVGGQLFDVQFVDGSCFGLFDGCDSVDDFAFDNQSDALDAAQALLDQVLIDGPLGALDDFDSNPALISGCGDPGFCGLLTPYGFDGSFVGLGVSENNAGPDPDRVFSNTVGAGSDTGLSRPTVNVYAVWTEHQVPEPGIVSLMAFCALAWLAGRPRRRQA